jgi:hypothetical protein
MDAGPLTWPPSNYDAWRIDNNVWFADRRDHTISARTRRSEIDEQNLIVVVINDFSQFRPECDQFTSRQSAFEHRELQVIAPTAHGLEHVAQPFGVRDVVANDIGIAHDS